MRKLIKCLTVMDFVILAASVAVSMPTVNAQVSASGATANPAVGTTAPATFTITAPSGTDPLVTFTSRAVFGGNDSEDWTSLGPCFVSIPNPFTATSTGGDGITGSFAATGGGQVRIQSTCAWAGNFASGDHVVWTTSPGHGPLTLAFNPPLVGVGAQIMADFFGPFTGKLDAYSGATLLGSFTEAGNSNPAGNNSAIFMGVKTSGGPGANITKVVFSVTSCTFDCADFAINKLSMVTPQVVAIDIKPDADPARINPGSKGQIPVAILSSPTFNAPVSVNPSSLTFGETGNEQSLAFCSGAEDVNGDGLLDLVCHFSTELTGFQSGDTKGILKGQLFSGTFIYGTEAIVIVP